MDRVNFISIIWPAWFSAETGYWIWYLIRNLDTLGLILYVRVDTVDCGYRISTVYRRYRIPIRSDTVYPAWYRISGLISMRKICRISGPSLLKILDCRTKIFTWTLTTVTNAPWDWLQCDSFPSTIRSLKAGPYIMANDDLEINKLG